MEKRDKYKVLVLTDHMPWGHRSIAKAIAGFLKSKEKEAKMEVAYAEVKAETGVAGDTYILMTRFFPTSSRWMHRLGDVELFQRAVVELSAKNIPALKKVVNWYQPDLIISSYFFLSHSLSGYRHEFKKPFELWTVVADPRTINEVQWVPGADLHLVYDEAGKSMGVKAGIDKGRILETGWWVRPEMYASYDKEAVRRKLGFDDDRRVVFVGGGSLGTNALMKVLPATLMVKDRLGVVFNTATDKLSYSLVKNYIQLLKSWGRQDMVKIKLLGWIDNMAEVLSGVDLVMGKAGPNFLFDVVAVKRPIVAITHMGGQEDGNLDLIEERGLGWVKERGGEAVKFLVKYLAYPDRYEKVFAETIAAEAARNQGSMGKIYKRILPKVSSDRGFSTM